MSITFDQYRRARHIADPAAAMLQTIIRPDPRGRASVHPRVLLTGMLLSIDACALATVTSIHRALTRDLPRDLQWDLGVLTGPARAPRTITVDQLYKLTKRISSHLDHTKTRAAHLPDAQRYARRAQLDAITTELLTATLFARDPGSCDYALDGTGIWAAERSPSKIGGDPPAEQTDDDTTTAATAQQRPTPTDGPARGRGNKGGSDAWYGGKTSKDGSREMYFGYDLEALIRVPPTSGPTSARTEPQLVERLVVLPGSTDIVEPCLSMLDNLVAAGTSISNLLVDRHYSYKKYHRWLKQLRARRINQVADMHENDQGFAEWNGTLVAAGVPHCPGTPPELGVIPTLGPNASAAQRAEFAQLIARRQAYAVQFVNRPDADGKMKTRCPARNGTIGCPLITGSQATAMHYGLPIVAAPPTGDDCPAICRNDTATYRITTDGQGTAMKMSQKDYWGSQKWQESYRRRTYVEGWFGIFKGTSSTGYHRGSHEFRGLPMVSLVLACAAALTNMRVLRSWHAETGLGETTHPLLQPDRPHYGFAELTQEQAQAADTENALAQQPISPNATNRPKAA